MNRRNFLKSVIGAATVMAAQPTMAAPVPDVADESFPKVYNYGNVGIQRIQVQTGKKFDVVATHPENDWYTRTEAINEFTIKNCSTPIHACPDPFVAIPVNELDVVRVIDEDGQTWEGPVVWDSEQGKFEDIILTSLVEVGIVPQPTIVRKRWW